MSRNLINNNKMSTKKDSINISDSPRTTERNFAEQVPAQTIGPSSDVESAGEAVSVNTPPPVTVFKWNVMTSGDIGLYNAIGDFINTSKEGVKVAPDGIHGREKKLVFNYYGTMGKSIKPGEIGEFEVIFSYPPSNAL